MTHAKTTPSTFMRGSAANPLCRRAGVADGRRPRPRYISGGVPAIPSLTTEAAKDRKYKHKTLHRALFAGEQTAGSTVVSQLSYNSPLELIFYFSASAATIVPVATKMLTIFDRLQDSRVSKAHADLQVEALQQPTEHLRATDGKSDLGLLTDIYPGTQSVTHGAKALTAIESLEKLPADLD
jgi:hypothetical protein